MYLQCVPNLQCRVSPLWGCLSPRSPPNHPFEFIASPPKFLFPPFLPKLLLTRRGGFLPNGSLCSKKVCHLFLAEGARSLPKVAATPNTIGYRFTVWRPWSDGKPRPERSPFPRPPLPAGCLSPSRIFFGCGSQFLPPTRTWCCACVWCCVCVRCSACTNGPFPRPPCDTRTGMARGNADCPFTPGVLCANGQHFHRYLQPVPNQHSR